MGGGSKGVGAGWRGHRYISSGSTIHLSQFVFCDFVNDIFMLHFGKGMFTTLPTCV